MLTPTQCELLREVEVRLVTPEEGERWYSLMRSHHYLGLKALTGESLCYVAQWEGQWLALLGWGGPALECGPRDRWIGWKPVIKWQRINYIVNNSRFLLLPGPRIPNLASRVLALNLKRLAEDWLDTYGHEVLMAETFVDPTRFSGSCYKGCGWFELGMTSGWRKSGKKYIKHNRPKKIFVRPLRLDAVEVLSNPQPHDIYQEVKPMKLSIKDAEALMEVLRGLPDPRYARGRRHSQSSMLAVAICAVLSGAKSYVAIGNWASLCAPEMLERLGCRRNPSTGRRQAPSEPTLRRCLQSINADIIDQALGQWLAQMSLCRKQAIAIDGKTLRGAKDGSGRQVHLLSAFLHRQGVVVAQKQVAAKSNEITAVPDLLEDIDIQGRVITADAMHTQKKTVSLIKSKGAHFLGQVKDNQPTLSEDIDALKLPESFPPSGHNMRKRSRQA